MRRGRDTLHVGVIGLGLVSSPHLDGYEAAGGCELVSVCDVCEAKVAEVSAARGIRGTTDYRSVLADPEVDAVVLLLPHALHYEVARLALESGKHVCIEKPITISEGEAEDLIAVADARNLVLAVAENTRYVHAYLEAERLIREDKLGEVRLVRGFIPDQILDEWADTSDDSQAWKREPNGCGALIDCAPHMFHLLTWFFGDVERLQAVTHQWVDGIDLENHAVVVGRMVEGPLFSLEFCSLTEYPRGERVEIYGSDGTLVIDQVLDPPMVLYRDGSDLKGTPIISVPYNVRGWKAESIRATAADFVDSILRGRRPGVTGEESSYVVRLVVRAYESAASGGLPVDGRPRGDRFLVDPAR